MRQAFTLLFLSFTISSTFSACKRRAAQANDLAAVRNDEQVCISGFIGSEATYNKTLGEAEQAFAGMNRIAGLSDTPQSEVLPENNTLALGDDVIDLKKIDSRITTLRKALVTFSEELKEASEADKSELEEKIRQAEAAIEDLQLFSKCTQQELRQNALAIRLIFNRIDRMQKELDALRKALQEEKAILSQGINNLKEAINANPKPGASLPATPTAPAKPVYDLGKWQMHCRQFSGDYNACKSAQCIPYRTPNSSGYSCGAPLDCSNYIVDAPACFAASCIAMKQPSSSGVKCLPPSSPCSAFSGIDANACRAAKCVPKLLPMSSSYGCGKPNDCSFFSGVDANACKEAGCIPRKSPQSDHYQCFSATPK